jgi:hypothetical protein
MAEADAVTDLVCHYFIGFVGRVQVAGSAAAGAECKARSRIAVIAWETR